MLKWAVAAVGAILVVLGAVTATQGWAIVQVERGWSQVIAGSTILTGGCLMLALAAVIARIDALIAGVDLIRKSGLPIETPAALPVSISARAAEPVAPLPSLAAEAAPVAVDEDVAPPPVPPPAAPVRSVFNSKVSQKISAIRPRRPVAAPLPAELPPIEIPPEPQRANAPPARVDLMNGEWPDFGEFAGTATPAATPEYAIAAAKNDHAEEPKAEEPERPPTLVRRYESAGVAYQLFGDGSIEAQTESGSYRFASLAELREFIESKR